MRVHHRFDAPSLARACALTIGNFDGVHRGHQAMLALLANEARHRGVASCVLTFEPHPRDFFAARASRPEIAPTRVTTLRDKLAELERCGIDQTVVLRFDARLSAMAPEAFIERVVQRGLGARYVLVGDDFRFGAQRAGDYVLLDAAGSRAGFDGTLNCADFTTDDTRHQTGVDLLPADQHDVRGFHGCVRGFDHSHQTAAFD